MKIEKKTTKRIPRKWTATQKAASGSSGEIHNITPNAILERTAGNFFTVIKSEDFAMSLYRLILDLARENIENPTRTTKTHLVNVFMGGRVITYDLFHIFHTDCESYEDFREQIVSGIAAQLERDDELYMCDRYNTALFSTTSNTNFLDLLTMAHSHRYVQQARERYISGYIVQNGNTFKTNEEAFKELLKHNHVVNVYIGDPNLYFNQIGTLGDFLNVTSSIETSLNKNTAILQNKQFISKLTMDGSTSQYLPSTKISKIYSDETIIANIPKTYNMFFMSATRNVPADYAHKFHVFTDHKYDEIFLELLSVNANPVQFENFKSNYLRSGIQFSPYYLHSVLNNVLFKNKNNLNESHKGSLKFDEFMDHYRAAIRSKATTLIYVPKKEIKDAELAGLDIFKDIAIKTVERMKINPETKAAKFLLVGPPGTGKTAAAKWLSVYTGRDLYQLDIGKALNSTLGSSEATIRADLDLIRKLGPIVLHIDEIEKTIGGVQGSNRTDGGVLVRIMEYLMRFLAEPPSNIIILATANILRDIPPELIRTGRMSYVFYVDYPDRDELAEMIQIHGKRFGTDVPTKVAKELATMLQKRTEYCGSDVATMWEQADILKEDHTKPPTLVDFMKAFLKVQPTYEKLEEKVDENRVLAMQFEPASSRGKVYQAYHSKIMGIINQFSNLTGDTIGDSLSQAIQELQGNNKTIESIDNKIEINL